LHCCCCCCPVAVKRTGWKEKKNVDAFKREMMFLIHVHPFIDFLHIFIYLLTSTMRKKNGSFLSKQKNDISFSNFLLCVRFYYIVMMNETFRSHHLRTRCFWIFE
jgi:hypothetical protein